MITFGFFDKKLRLPGPGEALPGRSDPIPTLERHRVNGRPLKPPHPDGLEVAVFGMGCFWGAERLFWRRPGVHVTAVGYAGGGTPNPTYEEVCSGATGHTEVVRVVFDPRIVAYDDLLRLFFESHDPTQGMRQGNDVGTQYRSAIYTTTPAQAEAAAAMARRYDAALRDRGLDTMTTEIRPAPPFYFAEDHHQQYLQLHPNGYCGLAGTGVACPVAPGDPA